MALKLHPQWLPDSLDQTYRVLVGFAQDGTVHTTYGQLMESLGLSSPAPLLKRLESLVNMGVIQIA
jgi:DNA-binding Lrp family transcriptional regulator